MKVPLRFQITEFDCGTVALLNSFSYLFERENIPAALIKAISTYTLDCYDEDGNIGEGGTSREAIALLTKWITNYANKKNFGVSCIHLTKDEITIDKLKECLNDNGVIFIRLWQTTEHYVIITKINDDKAYIFDSYYLDEDYYKNDNDVKIVLDSPFTHNRIVSITRLFSETNKDFSLGKINNRECVLITKSR